MFSTSLTTSVTVLVLMVLNPSTSAARDFFSILLFYFWLGGRTTPENVTRWLPQEETQELMSQGAEEGKRSRWNGTGFYFFYFCRDCTSVTSTFLATDSDAISIILIGSVVESNYGAVDADCFFLSFQIMSEQIWSATFNRGAEIYSPLQYPFASTQLRRWQHFIATSHLQ